MQKKITIIILTGIFLTLAYLIIFHKKSALGLKNKLIRKIENKGKSIELDREIYGIDISHYQGKINWGKVKKWERKKISFVYIKATEGSTLIDPTYQTNFKEAKKTEILVGSYHFFTTKSSIKTQFENFIQNVDKDKQDLIPLIDVEEIENWGNKEFHKNFNAFLKMVEEHFGKKPMIYTVNSFYNINLSGKYKPYHFLIARYGDNSPNMRDKSNWTIWQFSEIGQVEGIPKNVDLDVLNSKFGLNDIRLINRYCELDK